MREETVKKVSPARQRHKRKSIVFGSDFCRARVHRVRRNTTTTSRSRRTTKIIWQYVRFVYDGRSESSWNGPVRATREIHIHAREHTATITFYLTRWPKSNTSTLVKTRAQTKPYFLRFAKTEESKKNEKRKHFPNAHHRLQRRPIYTSLYMLYTCICTRMTNGSLFFPFEKLRS